jgi:hypothetical protein
MGSVAKPISQPKTEYLSYLNAHLYKRSGKLQDVRHTIPLIPSRVHVIHVGLFPSV